MYGPRDSMPAIGRDGYAVEGNSQVIPHRLYPVVVFSVQPGENGIAWKEVGPFLKAFSRLDADLGCPLHYWSARIRRENIGPEFGARKSAANIHDEAYRFSPFYLPLSRIPE